MGPLYNFSSFQFVELCFRVKDIVYPGECSMDIWAGGVYSAVVGRSVLYTSVRFFGSIELFGFSDFLSLLSLLIFCLLVLSVAENGILKFAL